MITIPPWNNANQPTMTQRTPTTWSPVCNQRKTTTNRASTIALVESIEGEARFAGTRMMYSKLIGQEGGGGLPIENDRDVANALIRSPRPVNQVG